MPGAFSQPVDIDIAGTVEASLGGDAKERVLFSSSLGRFCTSSTFEVEFFFQDCPHHTGWKLEAALSKRFIFSIEHFLIKEERAFDTLRKL